jgi:hypothetical protein
VVKETTLGFSFMRCDEFTRVVTAEILLTPRIDPHELFFHDELAPNGSRGWISSLIAARGVPDHSGHLWAAAGADNGACWFMKPPLKR